MRPHALAGPAALVAVVLAVAPSATASAGGTPGPLHSGGAAYGSALPLPDARPLASRLTISPRAITNGEAPPSIRFRIRQRGIERVQARVVVLRVPRNAPVARVSLGWVQTGRRLIARWPRGVALRSGRYLVRLHVKDSRGRTLLRSARFPGRARIVVHRPKRPPRPPAAPAPAPAPPGALPAPAPSPAGPGVFPVAGVFDFGGPGARFGAGRTGHTHEGQDIMAAAGTPVVAPYPGTISRTSFQASGAGEYVVLDATDGRDYFFAHCARGSTAVTEGATVAAGQPLCRVGATGTTSGAAHLHFEVWNIGWRVAGGHPIDPLPELRTWSGR